MQQVISHLPAEFARPILPPISRNFRKGRMVVRHEGVPARSIRFAIRGEIYESISPPNGPKQRRTENFTRSRSAQHLTNPSFASMMSDMAVVV